MTAFSYLKGNFMKAEFITAKEFEKVTPINVFHKEQEEFTHNHPEELKNKHYIFRRKFNCVVNKIYPDLF